MAGSALAAAGQYALTQALPSATDGANVLRVGVEELLGAAPQAAAAALPGSAPGAAVSPVVAQPLAAAEPIGAQVIGAEMIDTQPVIAEAADLVKAADLHRAAADAAAAEAARAADAARAAEQAKAAEQARAAEQAQAVQQRASKVVAAATGTVQMVVGQVTSGFGPRWGTFHQGLDVAAPIGTPINAPLAGTVIDSGPASGFGLWVRLRHADGTITVYGHINRSLVSVGQQVAAGQQIAEVGNRGEATGPHLHIEVITPAGTKINPQPWLDQNGIGY